jgi:hypothetical protein
MKANHPGRYLALALGRNGDPLAVVKVATTQDQAAILQAEYAAIEQAHGLLTSPVRPPEILGHDHGSLTLAPAAWRARRAPWELPEEVAEAMGRFFRAAASASSESGPAHGDFAPWNLLETDDGWTLVDWEGFMAEGPPFYDLFHYVVQSHTLLGRPSTESIVAGLRGEGWIGRAVGAYAESAGLPPTSAREWLMSYLEQSTRTVGSGPRMERAAVGARRRLLSAVGG